MHPAANHVEAGLIRAIVAQSAADGAAGDGGTGYRKKPVLIIEDIRSTDWASATFVGQTVAITFRFEGDAEPVVRLARALAVNLPEREFTIAGRIVADLAVSEGELRAMDDGLVTKSLTVNVLVVRD